MHLYSALMRYVQSLFKCLLGADHADERSKNRVESARKVVALRILNVIVDGGHDSFVRLLKSLEKAKIPCGFLGLIICP